MKRFILYLFLFLVFAFSIFVSGVVESQDGLQYLAVARNIYYGKGPTAPLYEYIKDDTGKNTGENIHMSTYVGKDGRTYSFTGLGYSLAMIPAVALTDSVYKHFDIQPPVHFPLESDWLGLLTPSFTNTFFAALLGITLFLFFLELNLTKRQSIIMTFISLFTTNLFVYSKHLIPHMMFVSSLVLSFYLLKRFSRTKTKILLIFSGANFGVALLTYNLTSLLALLPYILYYVALIKPSFNSKSIKETIFNTFSLVFGAVPFIYISYWFENLKAPAIGSSSISTATNFISFITTYTTLPVFFEGVFGQLFSPGRSIFIYSPVILVMLIFWFKIQKKLIPELILLLSYSFILIVFYSVYVLISTTGEGVVGIWHGESSWGPRYLTPLIPLAMLVVSHLYTQITRKAKFLVFVPLCLVGLYVEFMGILMPYQIKFQELEKEFFINNTNYNVYVYTNLLPRYSPIIMMSKKLVKLSVLFPLSHNYGKYNVRFFDGISFPFNVGPERWRAVEETGYISFDNNSQASIEKISFDLINHPISDTKAGAKVYIVLNVKQLQKTPVVFKVTERKTIGLSIDGQTLKDKGNILIIKVDYGKMPILKENKQILGLIGMYIDGQSQNLESISVPNVSALGPKTTGAIYNNWGGTNKDPWKVWDIHTQTFERLPDFWWIRNLFYWDVPRNWILLLFGLNITGLVFFGIKLYSTYKKLKG